MVLFYIVTKCFLIFNIITIIYNKHKQKPLGSPKVSLKIMFVYRGTHTYSNEFVEVREQLARDSSLLPHDYPDLNSHH